MQFVYESASATLKLISPRSAKLINLYSKNPGNGDATQVLHMVVEYVDQRGLDVFLTARRYGYNDSRGLSNRELVEFYKKFGFELMGDSKCYMYRGSQESHAL